MANQQLRYFNYIIFKAFFQINILTKEYLNRHSFVFYLLDIYLELGYSGEYSQSIVEMVLKEATEKLHICSIGKNCRGKSKTAGGFIWKFV